MSTSSLVNKVAVIIVTYNGATWIGNCVSSVLACSVPVEVFIVDNGSTDNTLDIVKQFRGTCILSNPSNVGFGAANNQGLKAALLANADFFFLLNQDTVVEAGTIERLVIKFLSGDDSIGVLSPVHLDGSGKRLDSGFKRYIATYCPDQTADNLLRACLSSADVSVSHVSIPFVNAAAWMLSKDTLRKAGGFAPLFFHYGEDRDYANRLEYLGIKIAILPGACIRHFREERNMRIAEWPYAKKMSYYYVGFLSRVSDVNKNIVGAFVHGLVWMLKETVAYLFRGSFDLPLIFLSSLWRILTNMPAILRHRSSVTISESFKFLE